jgi:hypothetical protein
MTNGESPEIRSVTKTWCASPADYSDGLQPEPWSTIGRATTSLRRTPFKPSLISTWPGDACFDGRAALTADLRAPPLRSLAHEGPRYPRGPPPFPLRLASTLCNSASIFASPADTRAPGTPPRSRPVRTYTLRGTVSSSARGQRGVHPELTTYLRAALLRKREVALAHSIDVRASVSTMPVAQAHH